MKHTIRNIAAAFAGAILVSAALPAIAQQGPPGGGQRGPGGQGGPGGMRGQRGPDAGAIILRQKKVQVHLKLTESQITQIMEILPPDRRGGMGGPGGPGGQGGPGMGGQRGQGQGGQRGQGGGQGLGPRGQGGPGGPGMGGPGSPLDGPLKEIMGEAQFNRYNQLRLQFEGAVAIGRPDISQKLGITEDQQAKIRQIMEQNRPTPPAEGQRPDPAAREAQRAAVNRMIENVLTSAQKVKWNEMLGAKFEFERPQGPPPTL